MLKELDRAGLGAGGGDTTQRLQPMQSDATHVSVDWALLVRSLIESSLGLWNESKTNSEDCPIALRMWDTREATRILRLSVISRTASGRQLSIVR